MNPGKDRIDPYDTECTGTEEDDNGRDDRFADST